MEIQYYFFQNSILFNQRCLLYAFSFKNARFNFKKFKKYFFDECSVNLTEQSFWFIICDCERKGRQRTDFRKERCEESPGSKGKDNC